MQRSVATEPREQPHGAPPGASPPLLARLTAPAGPPSPCHLRRAGAEVLAIPGRYCVTYLVLSAGAVAIVDVGSLQDCVRVRAALDWLGRAASEVRFVLPTHLHFDHVLGIDALATALGIPVALGEVALEHVTRGRPLRWPSRWHLLRAMVTWVYQGMPLFAAEDWTHLDFGFPWVSDHFRAPLGPVLRDGEALPGFPGWTVLATPGHADDAISLHHAAAGLLIAGDTVRNFLGGEWNPLLCDAADYTHTQRRLRGLDVSAVLPGHGPIIQGERVLERLRQLPCYIP